MTITKDMIAVEYSYDADKGQLIRLDGTGRKRKDPQERTAPYCNVTIAGNILKEHRAIWMLHNGPIPEGMQLDHKDGNPKNNRIKNLRLCTSTKNNQNKTLYQHCKSGFKGVHPYQDNDEKFFAYITVEGARSHLGTFDTAEDAAIAYDEAAEHYFGELARTNRDMSRL